MELIVNEVKGRKEMKADVFTNPLPKSDFERHWCNQQIIVLCSTERK